MMRSNSAGRSGFSRTAEVGVPIQNGFEDHAGRVATKRQRPVAISYSTAPNENRSVRASSSLPSHLLRRHIGDCAQRRARTGQVLLRVRWSAAL